MVKNGPILLIEDDRDDQQAIREVLQQLEVDKDLKCFNSAAAALEYLKGATNRPFLIISNVHLHKIDGIELRQKMEEDPHLKDQSIPFIFMSTDTRQHTIRQAYNLTVQGYFKKDDSLKDLRRTLKIMIDYWELCKRPNTGDTN